MIMKRATIFKNGASEGGRIIEVRDTLDDVLSEASKRLGFTARQLYLPTGGLIEDVSFIRDDDILYASSGEQFIPCTRRDFMVKTNNTHQVQDQQIQVTHHQLCAQSEWVRLNVGGKLFVTTISTLTSTEADSMLARMFTHGDVEWQSRVDESGAYLIDRSPHYFEPILNYLRHGQLVLDRMVNPEGILEEAKFFGLTQLINQLEELIEREQTPDDNTPITRRELVMALMVTPTNKELRCQGVNFTGANLSKLDLRYINFKYAILKNANLSGANLSYCNFERADLCNATLDSANLLGVKVLCANMEGASLRSCNFEDPAGSRANMEGALMKNVDLEGSHMAGVNLRVATLKNANLQNCDLRGAVLAGADLENCDLSGCDLQEANLRGANLKGGYVLELNSVKLTGVVLGFTNQGAPDDFLSKESFDAIQNFIITKPELQGRLITLTAFGNKFVGCPVGIDDPKYKRNAFIFNVCFVFSEDTNTASYGPEVKKLAAYLIQLEMEGGFLTNENKETKVQQFLERVRHDLNHDGLCNIEMDESCTVHLKVTHQAGQQVIVQDQDVPILTDSRESLMEYPWDLTTQQILHHVDGVSHVMKIAAEADVDIILVKACLQNLLYFDVVKMVSVFQYSNVYTCMPGLHKLLEDKAMQEDCLRYVAKNDHSVPTFRDVFMLYCSLTSGTTVKDLCTRLNPHNLKVDERRLIQFGILKGLIRRMQKYPIKLPNERQSPRLQPILKWLTGSYCYDEISCKTGLSHQQLEEIIESDPSCVVCWK